ncbi:Fc.00g084530.m01.CDS01 [Cosmosporella sp. VM-42]
MSTQYEPPLPQSAGYGVVVGLGVAFALGMIWVTRAMKKSFNEDNHSTETFKVANRSVGVGLTAAAVISSWLYSTALLGASLLTYRYGVALGVWWGASASTMVCFLSLISIEAKRRAPQAHTLLELIKVRYGKVAHILWIVFCLVNNLLLFSSMLLGASTAVTALTGMPVLASTYLMPVGVAVYTYFGGLRATFLTDYVHTFIIMIILAWFTIKIIVVNEIGSIGALYDAVVAADKENPVKGNYQGSHLTMRSDECLCFGILHVISNIGAVIMDTGFWQKGFSADIAAAVPGYVLGGVASFSVPWTVGTVVGLAAIALERTPAWPIYPRLMSPEEVSSGLVLPFVAQAVAGKAGAAAFLVTIFMACTSIASAQMIATIFNQIKVVKSKHGRTAEQTDEPEEFFTPDRVQYIKKASRWAAFWFVLTLIGHILLWPLPMYGAKYIFTKPVTISSPSGRLDSWLTVVVLHCVGGNVVLYLWFTLVVANFYPLFDGGFQKIWTVMRGRKTTDKADQPQTDSAGSGSDSLRTDPKAENTEVKVAEA